MSAGFQRGPDLVAFPVDTVLDEAHAVLGGVHEGGAQADDSGSLSRLEFGAVEVVDLGVVAAEVAQQVTGGPAVQAVQDGSAEGSETGARADQDRGDGGVLRQAEGVFAGEHPGVDGVAGAHGLQVVRGDATEGTRAAAVGFLNNDTIRSTVPGVASADEEME